MQRIQPGTDLPLHTVSSTRALEARLAATLPPHTLMQRAGLAAARLVLALRPHADRIWIACGPGNNGGDGIEAAINLRQWGKDVCVTWFGQPEDAPDDAQASYRRALGAAVPFLTAPPLECDLCVDALLGIGMNRSPESRLAACIIHINKLNVPVLSLDLPSGLQADTGATPYLAVQATHTLSLLTLKPGLYMAQGRDASGQVWLDTLGIDTTIDSAAALLNPGPSRMWRSHSSHKGSFGDIAVIGGAPGMAGAPLLAARAALHHGTGRVFVGLLNAGFTVDIKQPELMLRAVEKIDPTHQTIVAGCGGGLAIAEHLIFLLTTAPSLVLDADAINVIASDDSMKKLLQARQSRLWKTVLTPHPLEAARLLGLSSQQIQADRLKAAHALTEELGCTIVLKGSGTVIATPDELPRINPTGNGLLATAGTGDVLAGLIGARLARGESAFTAACAAVYLHGEIADYWQCGRALTASTLADAVSP